MFRAIGPAARHFRPWVAVTVLAAVGCSDGALSPEDTAVFAKGGGGGGPSVNAADPNSAPQDTTLEVRVIGSRFDQGSTVRFLLAGESTPKIVTNASTYVSSDTLIANITVAADADATLYDIEVTTLSGKKGQGSELFSVKADGPAYSVEVTELGTLDGVDRMSPSAITTGPTGTHVVGSSSAGLWHMVLGGVPALLACEGLDTRICDGSANGARKVDVNVTGLVVGTRRRESDGLSRAVYWASPTALNVDLPVPFQHMVGAAQGVNGAGQAAGSALLDFESGDSRALLWTIEAGGVTVRDLHDETFQAYGPSSKAYYINDRSQVVGHASSGAFVWDAGSVVWLPGEGDVFPSAINNGDPVRVSGMLQNLDPSSTPFGETSRGVVWTAQDGALLGREDLPPVGTYRDSWLASDINDASDVVGFANTGSGSRALLWARSSQTGPYDIAIDLGPGQASAIDDLALQDGVTRVVGAIEGVTGKGKNQRTTLTAVMWTVRKLP